MLNSQTPTFYTIALSSDLDNVMELADIYNLFNYKRNYKTPPPMSVSHSSSTWGDWPWERVSTYLWRLPDVDGIKIDDIVFLSISGIDYLINNSKSYTYLQVLIEQLMENGHAYIGLIDNDVTMLRSSHRHICSVAEAKLITTVQVNGHLLQIVRVEKTTEWMTSLYGMLFDVIFNIRTLTPSYSQYFPMSHLRNQDDLERAYLCNMVKSCAEQIEDYYSIVKNMHQAEWALIEFSEYLYVIQYRHMPFMFIRKNNIDVELPEWIFLKEHGVSGPVLLIDIVPTIWRAWDLQPWEQTLIGDCVFGLAAKHRLIEIRRLRDEAENNDNWISKDRSEDCLIYELKNELSIDRVSRRPFLKDYVKYYQGDKNV